MLALQPIVERTDRLLTHVPVKRIRMALTEFRSIYLPYCLQRQADGSWVILNREYKPVGFNTMGWIDYGDYPVAVTLKGLGPAALKRIAYDGKFENGHAYLYNDGCTPTRAPKYMKAYLARLAILARLQAGAPRRKVA